MEVLLNSPPPPPPPGVPDLEEQRTPGKRRPLTHARAHGRCTARIRRASCHKMMDPIGLAMDNFDVTGRGASRQRNADRFARRLWDGSKAQTYQQLQAALLKRRETLLRTFTLNLMAYATGRRMEYVRHADRSQDCARRGGEERIACRRTFWACPKPRIPDASAWTSRAGTLHVATRFSFPLRRSPWRTLSGNPPRRTFLQGMGAMVALPFLDAMAARGARRGAMAAADPTRLLASRWCTAPPGARPFGPRRISGRPRRSGSGFDLAATSLSPLEPFRDYLTIVSNTDVRMAEAYRAEEIGGDHFRSSAVFLTQAHPTQTEGSDVAWARRWTSCTRSGSGRTRRSRRCSCASRPWTRRAAAPTATRACTPTPSAGRRPPNRCR
jgi:hypothetical protein